MNAVQPNDTGDLLDDPRVMQAVQQYLQLLEAGQHPNRLEFVRRYPDLAEPLAQCLDGLDLVHRATTKEKQSLGGRGSVSRNETAPLDAAPLGDFQIRREIGRGGMGTVYEAVQLSLGRRVALKVLPFAAALDAKQLQRFKNEAQAAAHLNHPNIVPVYAISCERGVHFYAMQYIEGQSLAALIESMRHGGPRQPKPLSLPPTFVPSKDEPTPVNSGALAFELTGYAPRCNTPLRDSGGANVTQAVAAITTERVSQTNSFFRRVAALGVKAAEALEYAHQVGIVHRDIKPANLMLDVLGNLWITDFGLASIQNNASLTMSGELLGTLRYMSPEQALAKRELIDHRTDIYSLGVTLYELLTLEPLFNGQDRQELLRQIATDEPRPPRAIDPSIPIELETIVLKAINKTPSDRYATAQALADDLQRFLDDKPILARRPTLVDRGRKWSRRHPALVRSGIVVLLLCIAGLIINNAMIAHEQANTAKRAKEAEERFRLAKQSVDQMIQISEEELIDNPQFQGLRKRLLESALAYYQEFIDQRRSDPTAQEELLETKAKVEKYIADLAVMQGSGRRLLLGHNSVQDELRLTDSLRKQIGELGEQWKEMFRQFGRAPLSERNQESLELGRAHDSIISSMLTPIQDRRLSQIHLQSLGPAAFRETDVIAKLKLTPEQRESIRGIEASMMFAPWDHRLPEPPDGMRRGEPPDGRKPGGGPPDNRRPPKPSDGSRAVGGPGREPPWKQRDDMRKAAMEQIQKVLTDEQKKRWTEMIGATFTGSLPLFPSGPPRLQGPPRPGAPTPAPN